MSGKGKPLLDGKLFPMVRVCFYSNDFEFDGFAVNIELESHDRKLYTVTDNNNSFETVRDHLAFIPIPLVYATAMSYQRFKNKQQIHDYNILKFLRQLKISND